MTCNFIELIDRIFLNVMIFAKNVSKDLSDKFLIIKLLDHFKQSATGALKTSLKRAIQKVVEATDNVISNKIQRLIHKQRKTE